ncbi:hypothetical protein CY34DRAFT_663860 [Suillus luteus UH-Slu-Lm8-n1]|uniref:Uncharacterized protein n=1 Tax=Suillus luteus UH-Slu-Lm8-n1 TaxID=930992 RepID=A0A0D0A231_9AGAM|nr:hypothetical protein CY34DRAFT_663860 [Suillus luteus UH-Slu-Lm8-n1]
MRMSLMLNDILVHEGTDSPRDVNSQPKFEPPSLAKARLLIPKCPSNPSRLPNHHYRQIHHLCTMYHDTYHSKYTAREATIYHAYVASCTQWHQG